MSIGADAEPAVIPLPANLDRQGIAALREIISTSEAGDHLILDASGVSRIGTLGVQFLLVALRSMSAQNRVAALDSPSSVVREAIADLGLTSHFRAWTSP